MNYSRQREAITKALEENAIHPTAETLYSIIRQRHPDIGKATLYRNLNQLANIGGIRKIDGLESSAHFDHNTYPHYHFICDKCGKVYDVDAEVAKDVVKKTEEITGFAITKHELIFRGVCKDCKK